MRKTFATLTIAAVGLLSSTSSALAGHPPASHLHSGEYCTKRYQGFYHRHGYTCKRASDGRLRLYSW
jgi:hypothetical protein